MLLSFSDQAIKKNSSWYLKGITLLIAFFFIIKRKRKFYYFCALAPGNNCTNMLPNVLENYEKLKIYTH